MSAEKHGVNREQFLRGTAGLAAAGGILPTWLDKGGAELRADDETAPAERAPDSGKAKSCIFIYLLGGPPRVLLAGTFRRRFGDANAPTRARNAKRAGTFHRPGAKRIAAAV